MVLYSVTNADADFVDALFVVVMSAIPCPSYTIQKVGYILLSVLKPKIEQKGMAVTTTAALAASATKSSFHAQPDRVRYILFCVGFLW